MLPELPEAPSFSPPDVVIKLGDTLAPEVVERALRPDAITERLKFDARSATIFFTTIGRFTVSQGSHILVEPLEGREPSSLRLPLLGAVLALLLEQRELFVLHAGAVDMGGFAAAFLGDKGQGKSTLNAAMSAAGFPLLGDDVVAVQWADSKPQTLPTALRGFAQIKLVPDAVRAVLNTEPGELALVAPELESVDKRSFMAPLAPQPLPLHHLFILTSFDEEQDGINVESKESLAPYQTPEGIKIRLLSPQEALLHLIPHTFGFRFGDLYLQNDRKTTHFRASAQLVNSCRVWELSRRRDLALLPATIDLIVQTVGASLL